MVRRRSTVGSAVLASALVLVAALAASPIDAAAKEPKIFVQNRPINLTASDPPPDHGSIFPVTVSGKLVYLRAILEGHTLKTGSKLGKAARARCPVGGVTVPLLVGGSYQGQAQVPVQATGSTVTDSSGAFSAVIQWGTSGGGAHGVYTGGVPFPPAPNLVNKAGKIGGHPVRCVIHSGLPGGLSEAHFF
jgi:hypothetical protein